MCDSASDLRKNANTQIPSLPVACSCAPLCHYCRGLFVCGLHRVESLSSAILHPLSSILHHPLSTIHRLQLRCSGQSSMGCPLSTGLPHQKRRLVRIVVISALLTEILSASPYLPAPVDITLRPVVECARGVIPFCPTGSLFPPPPTPQFP